MTYFVNSTDKLDYLKKLEMAALLLMVFTDVRGTG